MCVHVYACIICVLRYRFAYVLNIFVFYVCVCMLVYVCIDVRNACLYVHRSKVPHMCVCILIDVSPPQAIISCNRYRQLP